MHFTPDSDLAEEHSRWLSAFDPQYLRNWEKLLKADSEAAMCEAAVRRLLEENGNDVKPNEDLTGAVQAPDFRCTQGDKRFFVEATCISIEKATEVTGLSHVPQGAADYRPLNDAMFHACKQKTPQCSDLEAPALVAVGTFHGQASCICFLKREVAMLSTGEELIAHVIDTRKRTPVGDSYRSTGLRSATSLRPDMSSARRPVSGMLLCGFGCEPPEVRGVLHQSPIHEFDRCLLPEVEFCRLQEGYESGSLSTEWI